MLKAALAEHPKEKKKTNSRYSIRVRSKIWIGLPSPLLFNSDPEHQGTRDGIETQTRFAYDNLPGQLKSINLTY